MKSLCALFDDDYVRLWSQHILQAQQTVGQRLCGRFQSPHLRPRLVTEDGQFSLCPSLLGVSANITSVTLEDYVELPFIMIHS